MFPCFVTLQMVLLFACFSMWIQLLLIHSAWRTSFTISYRPGLLVTHSLSFCLTGNVFISCSFLKDNFAAFKILCWQSFFQCFEYVILLPLTSMVSDEKSVSNLLRSPYIWYIVLFLVVFKSLHLWLSRIWWWCVWIWVCPFFTSSNFLDV